MPSYLFYKSVSVFSLPACVEIKFQPEFKGYDLSGLFWTGILPFAYVWLSKFSGISRSFSEPLFHKVSYSPAFSPDFRPIVCDNGHHWPQVAKACSFAFQLFWGTSPLKLLLHPEKVLRQSKDKLLVSVFQGAPRKIKTDKHNYFGIRSAPLPPKSRTHTRNSGCCLQDCHCIREGCVTRVN